MTRRSILVLALCGSLSTVAAAVREENVDYGTVTRIREEAFGNSKVMDTLFQLTDVIGPRVTGSPQYKKAHDWTREQLESWGLANAHLESWEFGRGWSYQSAWVRMTTPTATSLIAVPKAFTPGTQGVVRGKVVKAKLESEADLEKWKGKLAGVVLFTADARDLKGPDKAYFLRYSDQELDELAQFAIPGAQRPGGPAPGAPVDREARLRRLRFQPVLRKFLVEEKVLATVDLSDRDGGIVTVGGGGSREKNEDPGPPALVMAAEHYNRISRLLDKKQEVELELDIKAQFHDDDPNGYNTIAEIPGTDKNPEIVMVGGHLDSWHAGTGATDNAAGCAVAMEAVRILKALDLKPKRTIRIGLWGGEEQGLLGSRAYVKEHFASRPEPPAGQRDIPSFMRPPTGPLTVKPDHARFSAYFNLDNGTGKIRGVYTQGNLASDTVFKAWLGPFADLGATTITNRNTGGTDHQSFDGVGLPGFQFIQDQADYFTRTHHTNMDVADRIQREDLMQASAVMASFLYHAAMRDERFPRKPMPKDPPPQAGAPGPEASPAAGAPAPKPAPSPSPAVKQ